MTAQIIPFPVPTPNDGRLSVSEMFEISETEQATQEGQNDGFVHLSVNEMFAIAEAEQNDAVDQHGETPLGDDKWTYRGVIIRHITLDDQPVSATYKGPLDYFTTNFTPSIGIKNFAQMLKLRTKRDAKAWIDAKLDGQSNTGRTATQIENETWDFE